MFQESQTQTQTREMRIPQTGSRIPRIHSQHHRSQNEQREDRSCTEMATANQRKTGTGILRILQLQQTIHQGLLQNHDTPYKVNEEGHEI